ncbi:MAG: hypothetical protein CBC35_03910 [Planctomycetes bacterium TMED75]|nr:hypothetical protein [Planctomycetaceae bacterium]OUU94569.1 MAG: hypothetical protein CBC35_03910 [Planctomycetes bacterium TMED75]
MLHTRRHFISIRPTLLGLATLACCQSLHGTMHLGPDWDGDNAVDAGSLPVSAQKVEKDDSNAVVIIRGELKGEEETGEGFASVGDYQDMYQVVIMNPGEFLISTTEPLGFSEFDSTLSVYDAEGRALLANEDAEDGLNPSRVGNTSTNGKFSITNPGVVYIAISGAGNRPRNVQGGSIFGWTQNSTDVVGPAFPAGQLPIDSWGGEELTGEYAIHLVAVGPVPSSCGVQNTEDCFVPHPTPFCADETCCELVCLQRPFCCEVSWDTSCAEAALIQCTPPPCNPACPGDLDYNGQVSGSDLAMILANWNGPGCTDINQDGVTNGGDLAIILAAWGTGCGTE